jgi:hypothetical protein
MMNSTFLQHFWLLCGIWCGGLNALMTWFRLRRNLSKGLYTEVEVNSFAKNLALWIFVPCVFLWVLQLSIGPDAKPFFVTWPSPQKYLATSLQIFIWIALLYWIFLRNGATRLSTYVGASTAYPRYLCHPLIFKIAALLIVFGSCFSLQRAF